MRLGHRLLIFAFAASCVAAQAESFSGKVTAVPAPDLLEIDRDGVSVEVRLYAADAPEPGQPFSDEALAFAKEKTLNQAVSVESLATDTLGKMVATVKLADGTDLAVLLVSGGYAWWDEKNAPEAKALEGSNAKALIAKNGLFKNPAALAPWDFRKSHGGDPYSYTTKPAEEKVAEKGPKELKLKGDMTESAPSSGGAKLPAGLDVPKDYQDLIAKHNPRIATDKDGKPLGVTADNIGDNPFAAAFGFQNGDIATGVNGIPIRSEADVLGAVSKLQGVKNLTVTVNRGGKSVDVPIPLH